MEHRIDEREIAVAGVYARSLLALAREDGAESAIGEQLAALAALGESQPELHGFLADPLIEAETRGEALEKMLRGRTSSLLLDCLLVMNRKGRLGLLPALAVAYRQELDVLRQEVDVEVTTAVPLDDEQREVLSRAVERYARRKPRLRATVDASILGGMVVRVGDRKIDGSVARDLAQLGERLVERAAKEIQSGKAYLAD